MALTGHAFWLCAFGPALALLQAELHFCYTLLGADQWDVDLAGRRILPATPPSLAGSEQHSLAGMVCGRGDPVYDAAPADHNAE